MSLAGGVDGAPPCPLEDARLAAMAASLGESEGRRRSPTSASRNRVERGGRHETPRRPDSTQSASTFTPRRIGPGGTCGVNRGLIKPSRWGRP